MWRRTVERECKDLNNNWSDMKQLGQSRVQWKLGVVDALCPGLDTGNLEEEKDRVIVGADDGLIVIAD